MTDSAIDRTITLHRGATGHKPLYAEVTSAVGVMPVTITAGDQSVHMRWSEWEEIRDHVEYCSTMKPDRLEADDTYAVCNAMPGLVPYDALPCILEAGHGEPIPARPEPGVARHVDRRGRSW